MELALGILCTSVALLAILKSFSYLYQLRRLNILTRDFLKKNALKYIILYSFWFLLFAGGILLLKKDELSILLLKIAFIILLSILSIKMLGSLIVYKQFFLEGEDELYWPSLRNVVIVHLIAWLVILGINILLFNF